MLMAQLMLVLDVAVMNVALPRIDSDLGFGPSIIRSKDGNRPGYLNTAWTMQAVRGVVLWLACCANVPKPVSTTSTSASRPRTKRACARHASART